MTGLNPGDMCSVEYTVTDGNGLMAMNFINWTVAEIMPPVATDDDDGTRDQGETGISGDASTNDTAGTDPNLTFTVASGDVPPEILNFVMNPDGTYSYDIDATAAFGDYKIPYTVTDGNGLTATANICVDVADPADPTATDDGVFGVIPVAPFVTDPLVNDVAGDFPLDPTSVTILTQDPNGTATVDPVTGEITMVANVGYEGPMIVEYEVCDTDGNCVAAEIEYEVCEPIVFESDGPYVPVGTANLLDLQVGDQFVLQVPAPSPYDVLHTVNFIGADTTLEAVARITLVADTLTPDFAANITTQLVEKVTGNPVNVPHCQTWTDLDSPGASADGAAFDPAQGSVLHLGSALVTTSGPGTDSSDHVTPTDIQIIAPPATGPGDWTGNPSVPDSDLTHAVRVQFNTGTADIWYFNEGQLNNTGARRGFFSSFAIAECLEEWPNFPEIPTT